MNFAGTPTGTGESALAMQIRIDLVGTSGASPYIEAVVISVKKHLLKKYVREYILDVRPRGTQFPTQRILDDIEAIISGTTDLSVLVPGEDTAVIMEPVLTGDGPISYTDDPTKKGTVNAHIGVQAVKFRLQDV